MNIENESVPFLTAANIKEAADLSYRQLNHWDEKGALPPSRTKKSGWRKYTPREFFVILVSAYVRQKFGVPLDSIRWLQTHMLKEGADYFSTALESMLYFGMPVLLLTDFKSTLVMDHPFDLSDLLTHGFLSGKKETGFVLLKVNALVNQVLSYLEEPFQVKESGEGYELLLNAKYVGFERSGDEIELLKIIRDRSFSRIEIHKSNGNITKVWGHQELDPMEDREIVDLIKNGDHEKVSITKADGETVRLERRVTFKLKRSS